MQTQDLAGAAAKIMTQDWSAVVSWYMGRSA